MYRVDSATALERETLSGRTLAMFYMDTCPYCREFMETFRGAESEHADTRFITVDLSDMENPLWDTFSVDTVPTLVLFESGRPIARKDGVRGKGLTPEDLQDIMRSAG